MLRPKTVGQLFDFPKTKTVAQLFELRKTKTAEKLLELLKTQKTYLWAVVRASKDSRKRASCQFFEISKTQVKKIRADV